MSTDPRLPSHDSSSCPWPTRHMALHPGTPVMRRPSCADRRLILVSSFTNPTTRVVRTTVGAPARAPYGSSGMHAPPRLTCDSLVVVANHLGCLCLGYVLSCNVGMLTVAKKTRQVVSAAYSGAGHSGDTVTQNHTHHTHTSHYLTAAGRLLAVRMFTLITAVTTHSLLLHTHGNRQLLDNHHLAFWRTIAKFDCSLRRTAAAGDNARQCRLQKLKHTI
jgi:hypothetical protein